ncbi:MAG: hypothetical protein LBJ00_11735 [Planctomycetaceae bacterium]|nr:hypothetical protein [Planctomycetaceae bacterium]
MKRLFMGEAHRPYRLRYQRRSPPTIAASIFQKINNLDFELQFLNRKR